MSEMLVSFKLHSKSPIKTRRRDASLRFSPESGVLDRARAQGRRRENVAAQTIRGIRLQTCSLTRWRLHSVLVGTLARSSQGHFRHALIISRVKGGCRRRASHTQRPTVGEIQSQASRVMGKHHKHNREFTFYFSRKLIQLSG